MLSPMCAKIRSLTLAGLFLCAAALSAQAAELGQADALRIVNDTLTLKIYVGVADERDFQDKPEHVIAAALFGAYDAKSAYDFEQNERREKGEAVTAGPLFSVDGRDLAPDQVRDAYEDPSFFEGLPSPPALPDMPPDAVIPYNIFVSRQAVELAALRFTGHRVTDHKAPEGDLLEDRGYFTVIDGLGDSGKEAKVEKITPKGEGFTLSGTIANHMEDEGPKSYAFTLELIPGDAPGTWKRAAFDIKPPLE